MLLREGKNLVSVKYRINRILKDEKPDQTTGHVGSTLLEKIRAEEATDIGKNKNNKTLADAII